jgi:hypothetical protein
MKNYLIKFMIQQLKNTYDNFYLLIYIRKKNTYLCLEEDLTNLSYTEELKKN